MASPTPEYALECSIPLPSSLDTRVYVRLTQKAKYVLLLLTTAALDEQTGPSALGSFVYAIPDRFNAAQPLATTLYSTEASLEFATRMAKLLARKTALPVYVGSSVSLASTTLGGTVEEEMEAFKAVGGVVLEALQHVVEAGAVMPNGV